MLEKFKELLQERKGESEEPIQKKNNILEYGILIIASLILALLINEFIIFKAYVPTSSMVPTLNVDDVLLVTRIYNKDVLQRGDIVVFYSKENDEHMVKRLIGLPGDYISIENGAVYINGELLKEEYVKNKDEFNGEYYVPEEEYFFLGDNRLISLDSRRWKDTYIKSEDIIGIVKFRIFPFKNIGSIK
ncbi:signal peptidase I [Clostridium carnis]